ncbi:MAG TPA: DegT/DnrJ/EryC1/StrS family aminotransferase, partial [Streptosporangiaceae bacterium]|nr:DegT/DnrJ/EryC1/StrS family aminotransferase [Streptosporangiaceae bacterium]
MRDVKPHPVGIADRDLLADVTAACRWWAAQRTWQVSSSFTGGGVIAAFERLVARCVARDAAALALPSATVALVTALRAIGAEPGTTVGVPALGWTGARAAARVLGISTRVLPVNHDTGLLEVARLRL